jgi:tyrosinase
MANQLATRVSIDTLSADGLALMRKGYAAMQAIGDDRGFNKIAGIHGIPGNYCHRVDILFLPWHRAYLYNFEQYLQDRVAGTCVPWWDWTSQPSHTVGIPTAFSDATDPAGQPNPLLKSHISVPPPASTDRDTTRDPDPPGNLPATADVNDVLKLADFQDFSEQLEQIHNNVHGWVGGDMGVIPWAAYDPIFFSHHAMIDRLWYIWQITNGINNIPSKLLDRVLPPFNMTVNDVLDISKLGYQYASGHVTG